MKIRLALIGLLGALLSIPGAGPAAATPNNEPATYELHMEVPNVAQAPNGDLVFVTGGGTFSVHPKSVTASGEFTHTDSAGNVLGGGTWTATSLLSFQPYGCGEVLGDPLPPNFCGGKVKMRVVLTAGGSQFEGVLTVFCIVGPNPPNSHDEPSEEGVTLNIIGVINFNDVMGGENIYIRTS